MKETKPRMGIPHVGMRVRLPHDSTGTVYTVGLVNDCRARLDPETKNREVTIAKRFGEEGETVTFNAKSASINISPNTVLEIL